MGENKDPTGLIILGIVLGAILAFALLNKKPQTLSLQQVQQPTDQHADWRPIDIPRVDDIKPQTDPQLVQMTFQLEKTAHQLEQATSKLQDTLSRLHNSVQYQQQPIIIQPIQEHLKQIQPQQDNQQKISNTVYKNNEQWEIKRGSDGRIKSLNIMRDIKKNS